ncbi:MAG: LysM peptidoglycan-binding domain-containing protein [Chloroflexi bacterium]|nr:LysM peptidoglycan-binding domain-containing protein [Chloroflexota bacterium]
MKTWWRAAIVTLVLLITSTTAVHAGSDARLLDQAQTVHVVQPGENLFRIALKYGTNVNAIISVNGLSSNVIYVGQRLTIPQTGSGSPATVVTNPSAPSGTYVVQPGDTLSRIALNYGVSLWSLMQANGLNGSSVIYPGQRLSLPAAGGAPDAPAVPSGTSYTVQRGDTLSSIAARYGTTAAALAVLNGISNPSRIVVGQTLRISGHTQAAPSYGGAKRLLINLSQQHLYAYQGDSLVYSFVISSGAAPYYTRTGSFRIQSKFPNAYGSTWNIWMPYWMGIYWAGPTENGIHALPVMSSGQTLWAGHLGRPVSYGCIVVGTYEARLLYEWAEIGTPVSITY